MQVDLGAAANDVSKRIGLYMAECNGTATSKAKAKQIRKRILVLLTLLCFFAFLPLCLCLGVGSIQELIAWLGGGGGRRVQLSSGSLPGENWPAIPQNEWMTVARRVFQDKNKSKKTEPSWYIYKYILTG